MASIPQGAAQHQPEAGATDRPRRAPATEETPREVRAFPPAGRHLIRFAWFTLGFTVITIVGGALVRATHSGDGCGPNWPSCDGQFLVTSPGDSAQMIEFTHRAISGVNLLLVAALLFLVLRYVRPPHPARRTTVVVMVLIIVEALIGAMIVLYGWVADDTSVARQVSVPLHLVNTFALTAALTLAVWLLRGGGLPDLRGDRRLTRMVAGLGLLLVLVAATGATTALADTVFTEEAIASGADLDTETALIVRLRILHPIVAVTAAVLLAWFVLRRGEEAEHRGHPWPGRIILGIVAIQVGLGFMHIALSTPLLTALTHLVLAQVLWIAFVFLALALLARPARSPGAVSSGQ
jgi:heme a synthase